MIVDELNKLKQTKASIKLALIDKGLNPTDVFSTYADDIRAIEAGSSSEFSLIGYDKNPNYITEGIAYAKEIQDNWVVNESWPAKNISFSNDLKLMFFPKVDTDYYADIKFSHCNNLYYVPLINTSKMVYLNNMFRDCYSLLEIEGLSDWDTSSVELCTNTFTNTRFVSFDLSKWNLDKCINIQAMFSDCVNLESVKLPDNMPKLCSFGLQETFKNCNNLKSVNIPSTTLEISISNMFKGCTSLESVDLTPLQSAKITEMGSVFNLCKSLKQVYFPNIDISLVKSISSIFSGCSSLEIIDFSEINTSNITNFSSIFALCTSLYKVINLDINSLTGSISDSYFTSFSSINTLRYLLLKNLGKNDGLKSISFLYITNWGDESNITQYPLSEGARQSLIDSLITYSFDRASAGYSSCTIKLYSTTKALLTEDEIALITAKGFTIA